MKKGIDDIKDQMRDVQREAHLIENDLQNRFTQMTMKNMQQRYLPQSITEEFNQFQNQLKEKTITDHIQGFSTMTQTKEAVMAKLGGYFDYPLYLEELRQVMSEKDIIFKIQHYIIEREFKSQALVAPEFKDKAFGRVPPYDFSANSVFIRDPIKEQEWKESQQQYSKSTNPYGSGSQNQRTTYNQKAANDRLSKRQPSSKKVASSDSNPSSQHSTPNSSAKKRSNAGSKIGKGVIAQYNFMTIQTVSNIQLFSNKAGKNIQDLKKMDLLSLKKQVIEEIKSEFELSKNTQQQPSSFDTNFTPSLDNIMKPSDNKPVELRAPNTQSSNLSQVIQQETDKQSQILAQIKNGQDQSNINQLRQSTQSMGSQQFSQSLLENAFADLLMSELEKAGQVNQHDEEVKKVGEELIMHKINNIFDEIARDNLKFKITILYIIKSLQMQPQPVSHQPSVTIQPQIQVLDQQQQPQLLQEQI